MGIKEIENSKDASYCRIVIEGDLNDSWSEWLGEVSFERMYQELSSRQTVIVSAVPDQTALRGLLNKIWDLNLTLISVNRQEKKSNRGINDY